MSDDLALEQAIEAVLIRYAIPAIATPTYNADRGDLASDLADAARSVFGQADLTVTVTANLDPAQGVVAEGGTPGPATVEDFAHVRNWVRGMILQIRGSLPAGWDIEVETLTETGAQRTVGWHIIEGESDGR